MDTRPSWDDYFLGICDMVSKRATCDRGRTACVMVRDKQILTTGYVGSPKGLPHCDEAGHEMRRVINPDGTSSQHCVRTVHAEQNAICQAARMGIALEGATMYGLMMPCYTCAKMLINAGIKRVVVAKRYHADSDSLRVLRDAGIELVIKNQEVTEYPDQ